MNVFVRLSSLLFLLFLVLETESQLLTITSHPSSPLRVLEEEPLTLQWRFSVADVFLRVQLGVSGSLLALVEASPGSTSLRGTFRGRVNASSTETNATIAFPSVNRIDAASYVFSVVETDGDFVSEPLQLIVKLH